MSTRVENLNNALAKSQTEMEHLNGILTTVRGELMTLRAKAVRNTDIRDMHQLVTDLSQPAEYANMDTDVRLGWSIIR